MFGRLCEKAQAALRTGIYFAVLYFVVESVARWAIPLIATCNNFYILALLYGFIVIT
jgi:hypothetical protein